MTYQRVELARKGTVCGTTSELVSQPLPVESASAPRAGNDDREAAPVACERHGFALSRGVDHLVGTVPELVDLDFHPGHRIAAR